MVNRHLARGTCVRFVSLLHFLLEYPLLYKLICLMSFQREGDRMGVVRRLQGHALPVMVLIFTLAISLLAAGLPANAATEPSFIDPTAILANRANVKFGSL